MAKQIPNPSILGNSTYREDISRAMTAHSKKVFYQNLEKTKPQYEGLVTTIQSDSMEEYYNTIGNLKPARVKEEGQPIEYGTIAQGYETVLKNITFDNGFSITKEAADDNKWGIQAKLQATELARTMNTNRERRCADVWDSVLTGVGVDGVPFASHKHPLLSNSSKFNDNLIEGEFSVEVYTEALNKFNEWFNHTGEHFDTTPDKIIAHRNRQFEMIQLFQSTLVPFEQSNTKNAIPSLNTVFNTYIDKEMVHLVDSSIITAVMQTRQAPETNSDYDKMGTQDFRFNVVERFTTGMLNNGFGFVTINGKKSAAGA